MKNKIISCGTAELVVAGNTLRIRPGQEYLSILGNPVDNHVGLEAILSANGVDTSLIHKIFVEPGVWAPSNSNLLFANFVNCTDINIVNLNTTSVQSMDEFVSGCSLVQRLDLSKLKTKHILSKKDVFKDCPKLKDVVLGDGSINLYKQVAELGIKTNDFDLVLCLAKAIGTNPDSLRYMLSSLQLQLTPAN